MIKKLFHIFALGVLLTLMTGCRFGNYAEAPKPNFKETYKSIDLYFTQPKKLTTTVVFNDNTSHVNATAPLVSIPTSVRNTFTNPTYFAIPIDPKSLPMFVGLNQTSYVSTQIDANGKVADDFLSTATTLWTNPNCKTQIELIQNGAFDLTRPGTVTYSDGSVSPVKGHLSLTFSYLRVISGDCQADLQELVNCYSSGTGCTNDQLNAASNLFDLYIRQTGVLSIADAIRVKGLAYEVQFE